MNLSGILVVAQPQWLQGVIEALEAQPGIEVHQVDDATGRIVVVQEADGVDAEAEGLERIRALPHVVLAQMVYHYFADDPSIDAFISGAGRSATDAERLNDFAPVRCDERPDA